MRDAKSSWDGPSRLRGLAEKTNSTGRILIALGIVAFNAYFWFSSVEAYNK